MAKYRSTFPVLTDAANYLPTRDVAELLGVDPAEAESIIAGAGFPDPARTVRDVGPVWLEDDIVAYLREQAKPVKLAGAHEVAELLGVPVETVRGLCGDPHLEPPFPPPLAELELGPVWRLDDVLAWKQARAEAWRLATPGGAPGRR